MLGAKEPSAQFLLEKSVLNTIGQKFSKSSYFSFFSDNFCQGLESVDRKFIKK